MGPKAGVTTTVVHMWAAIACTSCTHARRPTCPAFLPQLQIRPQSQRRGDASKKFQSRGRVNPTPPFSTAETADNSQQTSELTELDARVLNELLKDPSFIQSFVAKGVQLEDSQEPESRLSSSNATDNTTDNQSPKYGALAAGGQMAPGRSNGSSVFESATMKVVGELQDSFRGFLAKASAALESAGLYVSNRAQVDSKIVQAMVTYASRETAAGTGRLLLAATGAASPALLLMGVNTTEVQTNLNDSLQLLSMGIVPDSIGMRPKLLTSFKDFDDDDKRLDAAYRRQLRGRPNSLPAKILGALPSTINKAADLAYEVDQEMKYERAGSRANKLLRPVGLLLPEAKGNSLLMGWKPDRSGTKILEAKATDEASCTDILPPPGDRHGQFNEVLCADGEIIFEKRENLDGISAERHRKPLVPNVFGVFKRSRGKIDTSRVEEYLASAGFSRKGDEDMVATLVAQPHVLTKHLTSCKQATKDEIMLQDRRLRAVDALLCSTEPVIAGLEESAGQDAVFLDDLRVVAREVQEMYTLAEMAKAVEAAEAHLSRVGDLLSNAVDLAAALRVYLKDTNLRMKRLENIMVMSDEAQRRGKKMFRQDTEKLDFVFGTTELLYSFDDEKFRHNDELNTVNERVCVVRGESAERAMGYVGPAHEEAFFAACRLWDASASRALKKQPTMMECIRVDLGKREEAGSMAFAESVTRSELPPNRKPNERVAVATEVSESFCHMTSTVTKKNGGWEKGRKRESWAQEQNYRKAPRLREKVRHDTLIGGSAVRTELNPVLTTLHSAPGIDPGEPTRRITPGFPAVVKDADAKLFPVRDATLVSDTVDRPHVATLQAKALGAERPDESSSITTYSLGSEIVSDIPTSYFVDTEAKVEDDLSDPTRLALKFLDVFALLIEKLVFDGLPMVVSGGTLMWERVDNAVNGAKGRRGWRLLRRLKKESVETVRMDPKSETEDINLD